MLLSNITQNKVNPLIAHVHTRDQHKRDEDDNRHENGVSVDKR